MVVYMLKKVSLLKKKERENWVNIFKLSMKFSSVKDNHRINIFTLKRNMMLKWQFKTESSNQTENFMKLVSYKKKIKFFMIEN